MTQLQKRLTALGFYSGPITGTFGPLTEAAVKKLQKAHGLTQAGYVTITRRTRGGDIDAACGQLAGQVMDRTKRSSKLAAAAQ